VAKDYPKVTDGELQRFLESRGSESLRKKKYQQPLHHHVLFERVSRKILYAPPKTNSTYSVIRHDWFFKRDWSLSSDETKKGFLAANPPDVFGANRDQKYPMPTGKYPWILYVVGLFFFFCWRSWTSCSDTWYCGF